MTDENLAAAPAAAEPAAVVAEVQPAPQEPEKTGSELWNEIEAEEAKAAEKPADFPEPERQSDPAPAPTPAAEPAPAADIWANATPEQKAAFEAANAERDEYKHKFRSNVQRISHLQRKINAAEATKLVRDEAPAREAIAGIKTDYPEIAQPLEKVAEAVDGQREQVKKATQASIDADTAELNDLVAEETASLVEKHPDYIDVLKANGSAFKAWIDDQPLRIRQAAQRNASHIADSGGAIEVMNGFKKHLEQIAPKPAPETPPAPAPAATPAPAPQPALDDKRQRQLAGTATPITQGGRPTVSGIPEDGDPKAIWEQWDAHDRQKARA